MCKSRELVDAVLEEKKTATDILLLTNRHTTIDRGGGKEAEEGRRAKKKGRKQGESYEENTHGSCNLKELTHYCLGISCNIVECTAQKILSWFSLP